MWPLKRYDPPVSAVSTDTMLQEAMEDRLLSFLRDNANAQSPARLFYDNCLDRTKTGLSLEEARTRFNTWKIGQWPITDNLSSNKTMSTVWQFAAEVARDLGVDTFLGASVGLDPRTLDRGIVELGPIKPLFYSVDVKDAEMINLLRNASHMVALEITPNNAADAQTAADDVRLVQEALAPQHLGDRGIHPQDYKVMDLTELGNGVQEFLGELFSGVKDEQLKRHVMVQRPELVVKHGLDEILARMPVRALLNYIGFRAIVRMAPFLSNFLESLIRLHALEYLGRNEVAGTAVLCLRAATWSFPACFVNASHFLDDVGDLRRRFCLDQLRDLFPRMVHDVAWMNELTSLLVNYKMRNHQVALGFDAPDTCGRWVGSPNPMATFMDASIRRRQGELKQVGSTS